MDKRFTSRMLLAGVSLTVGTATFAQTPPDKTANKKSTGRDQSNYAVNPEPVPNGALPKTAEPTQATLPSGAATGDIIVTARRRAEKLENVPVSVVAFSPAALQRASIQSLQDIVTIAPGLTFSGEGGKNNTSITLRGIGKTPLGEGIPSVETYINNVPQPSFGGDAPTFDLASVQVLKGPQGTLFGRNTLAGAILINTQAPDYRFGGYAEGTYGTYNYREFQGALNIPVVEDKIAIRVAGQIRRQDPRTASLSGGPGFDDIHQNAFRASLLLEPFDGFKSTTIVDYFKANELASGLYTLRSNFPIAALFDPIFGAGTAAPADAAIARDIALQKQHFHSSFDDGQNGGLGQRKAKGITNDTSYSFGALTLRNIFGYRTAYDNEVVNTGNTGALTINLPGPAVGAPVGTTVPVPFVLFNASQRINRQYLTNESQLLGNFGKLNFVFGFFYDHDYSNGPSGSQFSAFSVGGVPSAAVTSNVDNHSKAVYAQAGYKITPTLTLNVGGRYSWDKVSACGGLVTESKGLYGSDSECRAQAALNLADGVGTVSNSDQKPSWTVDLDWKATPNWLLYVENRRGFRGANVNTPVFESKYTTGGISPVCNPTGTIPGLDMNQCPDLRSFQKTGVETLTDYEAGSKITFNAGGARGFWNLAIFYDKYKNALQFLNAQTILPAQGETGAVPDVPTSGSVGVNIANETIYGVETEISVSPSRNFTVSFNGAYTHVNVDSLKTPFFYGVTLTKAQVNKYSPSFSGTLSAEWTMPFRPFGAQAILNGDIFLTDDFGGQDGEKLPGYALGNARFDLKGISGTGIDVGVFVRNLTNAHYFSGVSVLLPSFPVSTVYAGEARTWGVTAGLRF